MTLKVFSQSKQFHDSTIFYVLFANNAQATSENQAAFQKTDMSGYFIQTKLIAVRNTYLSSTPFVNKTHLPQSQSQVIIHKDTTAFLRKLSSIFLT